jgi:D-tyrosyl-tRNA(Tyr) deacylase
MRAVVQRVSRGSVSIDGRNRASIGAGYVIFLGVKRGDTEKDARFLADKCSALRVMEDADGKMNLALKDMGGSALVVSQFTLYGDAQKGNRPGFADAAPPEEAVPLYDLFVRRMRELLGEEKVVTGEFRAMMEVEILNDGPVTILIESPSQSQPRSTR